MTADSSKTILIADDDSDTVSLLQFVFDAEGYKTITADDGLHAITQARQHRPDSSSSMSACHR